jgi:non-heme chloroperoxidase
MHSVVESFDGTPIAFTDSGGDGPAVVMLHGLTVTSRINWETCFEYDSDGRLVEVEGPTLGPRLRDAGARTVEVDARGHGYSGRSDDPDRYRGDASARDVQAVIDALGVDAVDLVGYSNGAATAARLLGLGESRLRSAALCGMPFTLIEANYNDGVAWYSGEVGKAFQNDDWETWPDMVGVRDVARLDPVHDFGSIGASWIAFGAEPVPDERLASATVPVLVVKGGGDNGDDEAARIAAMIPGAQAAVVGDRDHNTTPNGEAFHDTVLSFLREQWTGDWATTPI